MAFNQKLVKNLSSTIIELKNELESKKNEIESKKKNVNFNSRY